MNDEATLMEAIRAAQFAIITFDNVTLLQYVGDADYPGDVHEIRTRFTPYNDEQLFGRACAELTRKKVRFIAIRYGVVQITERVVYTVE